MNTECILWDKACCGSGYGAIKRGGKQWNAHRWVWTQHFGPIPPGMFVCHTCDVRNCVNPDHLFLGTNSDNQLDMHRKGRGPDMRGERQNGAKLTATEVRVIRILELNHTATAKRFGVTRRAVAMIRSRQRWAHVQ